MAKPVFTTSTPQSLPLPGISTALCFGHRHALRTCSPCLTAEGRSNGRKLASTMTECSPDFDSGFSVIRVPIQLLVQRSSAARGAWRPAPIQCRHFKRMPSAQPPTRHVWAPIAERVDPKQLRWSNGSWIRPPMNSISTRLNSGGEICLLMTYFRLLRRPATPMTLVATSTRLSAQPSSPTTKHGAKINANAEREATACSSALASPAMWKSRPVAVQKNMRRSPCMPTAQQLLLLVPQLMARGTQRHTQ